MRVCVCVYIAGAGAAAFGVTCHAREHFLQSQGAAPRTTSSSRRALQVRPAFPGVATAPPSDVTMRFLDMLRARDEIRVQKAAGAWGDLGDGNDWMGERRARMRTPRLSSVR